MNLNKNLFLKWLVIAVLLLGISSSIFLAAETTTYFVRSGDTLSSIAAAHGISLNELLQLNPEITDPNNIYVGFAIQIPTPEEEAEEGSSVAQCLTPYLIKEGDTWLTIAAEYSVNADILALVNGMVVTDDFEAGTKICIPVAPPVQTGPAAPATPAPVPATGEGRVHLDRLELVVMSLQLQGFTYDRDDWRHWIDTDRDCQNTRAEVLIEESLVPVTFRENNPCTVHSGLWVGPWGGEQYTLASDLDIDHHVPLLNAHLSGGASWAVGKKQAYANDLSLASALQATKNSLNRQKGARGPEEWKPPLQEAWCAYAQDWVDVKYKYNLTVTAPEKTALQEMLSTCDGIATGTAVHPVPTTVPSILPAPGEGVHKGIF